MKKENFKSFTFLSHDHHKNQYKNDYLKYSFKSHKDYDHFHRNIKVRKWPIEYVTLIEYKMEQVLFMLQRAEIIDDMTDVSCYDIDLDQMQELARALNIWCRECCKGHVRITTGNWANWVKVEFEKPKDMTMFQLAWGYLA